MYKWTIWFNTRQSQVYQIILNDSYSKRFEKDQHFFDSFITIVMKSKWIAQMVSLRIGAWVFSILQSLKLN